MNQSSTFLRALGYVQGLSWIIAALLLMSACPTPKKTYYAPSVPDVTRIDTRKVKWERTPKKAYIWAPTDLAHTDFYNQVDAYLIELNECLKKTGVLTRGIEFSHVYIYVPANWYTNPFGTQLIPSQVDPRVCNDRFKKAGLPPIRKECEWLSTPTRNCPVVCNVRAAIIDHHVVAATPDMGRLKVELARLVLYGYKYNSSQQARLKQCLK